MILSVSPIPQAPANNIFYETQPCTFIFEAIPHLDTWEFVDEVSIVGIDAVILTVDGIPYIGIGSHSRWVNAANPMIIEVKFQPILLGITTKTLHLHTSDTFPPFNAVDVDSDFDFNVECVDPLLYSTPQGNFNFGIVVVGLPVIHTVNVQNPTVCDITINTSLGSCFGTAGLVITPVGLIVIPPGGNVDVDFTWTPIVLGALNCSGRILVVLKAGRDTFIGQIEGLAIGDDTCLFCEDSIIKTENALLSDVDGLCSGDGLYDKMAIGELKTITYDLYYVPGLADGFMLWFNPSIFEVFCDFASKYGGGVINAPPNVAYYIEITPLLTPGAVMTLVGAGAAANNQRNIEARFTQVDPNRFTIELDFYTTQDVENWLTNATIINHNRLLKNSKFAASELTNTTPAVYNENRKICSLFYLIDPNELVEDPITLILEPLECYLEKGTSITGRFYNKGLYDGVSEFTNELFTFSRAGNPVTDLSTVTATDVSFKVDGNLSALQSCIIWLIDTSTSDNSIDFINNYDTSRAEIPTVPGVSILSNHLESPSTALTLIAGTTHETTFKAGTTINFGSTYIFIAVVYSTTSEIVNSFISDELSVINIPDTDCCPLNYIPEFKDYNQRYNARCFSPTMQERIQACIAVNAGNVASPAPFVDCIQSYDPSLLVDKITDNWIELWVTAVRLKVYRKVEDYPTVGQTTFFYFEQHESIKAAGFPGGFNNLNDMVAAYTIGTGDLRACFETRVRYEDNLQPSAVFVANNTNPYIRTSAGASASVYAAANNITFDWAEQDVIFEWEIEMDLSSLFPSPYFISQFYEQVVHARDYEQGDVSDCLEALECFEPEADNPDIPSTVEIIAPFCPKDYPFIYIKVTNTCPGDYNLIAFIDMVTYGIANLQEEDAYASTQGLTQLSSGFVNCDEIFIGNIAYIRVGTSILNPGVYKICALSKLIV